MNLLATIEFDGGGGRGGLFFKDTGIWCTDLCSGDEWDTETPCSSEGAIQVIQDAWGTGFELEFEKQDGRKDALNGRR